MTEPKKCPTGKYWCFTDKKCKKIPKGYHVMGGGRLMKDEDHEDGDENKNGGSNGNGDGGGVSENTILEKRDGKSAKDKGYSLRDWFRGGGWKQTGGKYDGKPCARQPGQKTKPFCRDADDRAAMSKKERNRRAAKKRREDPNPDRKGKAKIVTDSYAFSNWRKETNLQESDWTPVAGSIANASSQTFHYVSQNFETGDPNTATISGLGGVEAAPSEVTVNLGFGEKYPVAAPDYSQSSMQGYAQPLTKVQKRQDEEENEKIDAEIKKLLAQIDQLDQKRSDLGEEQAKTEPQYTGMSHGDFIDRTNEINAKWSDKMWPLQKKLNDNPVCIAADKCVGTKSALMRMNKAATKEHENLYDEYMRQTSEFQKAQDDHIKSYAKKFDSIRKEKEALNAKITELEKQRPINNQLDASQQVDPTRPYMGARVQPSPALRDFRNTSPVSGTAMGANLGTAKKIMIDYLTKDWDNRVVADNEYLGRDYIDKQFFKNVTFDTDGTYVGGSDAVVGTGQPPRVDPKTGEIVVRANFDFNKNEYEAIGDPEKQEFAQRLKRFGGMSDYALDAIVDGLPGNLGTLAGMAISPFVSASKLIGRGNNIPIVIRFTPQELKRKNKKQYDQLVRMGLIKESTLPTPDAKQVGEDLNRRDRKVIGKMVADSYDFSNWRDEFKALEFETVDIIGTEPLKPTEGIGSKMLGEKCWKGYEKKGMKTMFGKRYPNCVKKEETEIEEKKDPCWDTHKQVGMKKKNGRMVPNCVPKEETYSDWRTEIFEGDGDHEYEMARRQLATIKNAVSRLEKKMGETGEGELKAWVQAKLTRSADDIDTVADYVTNEQVGPDEQGELVDEEGKSPFSTPGLDRKNKIKNWQKNADKVLRPQQPIQLDKAHFESEGELVDEGKKDACYHKVKSRYSVWPSAYASGALVKCRKVGAKNWGNKSKTKKEEVQYMNTEDYQRIQEYGNVYTIIVLWRGKSHRLQLFFQGTARPSRDEVKNEVEKIYPGGMVSYYFPSATDPGKPIIVSTRS